MNFRMVLAMGMLAAGMVFVVGDATAAEPADTAMASLEKYFASWNELDAEKRGELLSGAWADDATYTDPTAHVEGRDALVAHIGGFRSNPQFKGYSLAQASKIDIHHQHFRFEWVMKDAEGNAVIKGLDYGEFDESGVITKIVGFFGPFQPME